MSVQLVSYYQWLTQERREHIMSAQLLRSGTSIGANIHEAHYAASRADFTNKLRIALKEASETQYWLIVLKKTGYFPKEFAMIQDYCTSLMRMLTASINTANENSK